MMPGGNVHVLSTRRGTLLAALLLLFGYRLLSGTPIPFIKEMEALFIVTMLGYVYVHYLHVRLYAERPSISLLELYMLVIQLVPLYSAWRAHAVFGQPLLYGALTQRYIWVSCVALVLLHLLRRNVLTLAHMQRALLALAWLSLAIYALLRVAGDPASYADEYPAFVTYAGGGEYVFKYEAVMMAFGGIYYLLCGTLGRSTRHLLLAIPFMLFLFAIVDKRSLDLAVVIAVAWSVWLYATPSRLMLVVLYATLLAAAALVMMYMSYPEQISAYVQRFAEALQVVLTGAEGNDTSSNARISETLVALPYIQSEWLLGNGDLSDQWADGYARTMGYFYPSDIGLLGGVFVYGVAGVLFLYLQFLFVKRPKVPTTEMNSSSLFLIAVYTMIVLLLVQSLIRGGIVFTPAMTLIFIVIAYHGSRQRQAQRVTAGRWYAVA